MCARRFLIAVFILILIFVAGAFLLFQYGQQILISQATPKGEFEAPPPASGPNYANADNWLARPDIPLVDDPSLWLPGGFAPLPPGPKPAVTFYIHPTTYLERDHWNGPLDHEESRKRAELFVRSQASAFNGVSAVWAPRYRQAAYGAFLLDSGDAQKSLDLAYGDVARAFDRFVTRVESGRPIILAGHSQGSLHLARLLREKIAGKPIARRIVAAYVVGWPLSLTADVPAIGLPACRTADQSSCILSWQSFRDPGNVGMITDVYEGSTGPNGITRQRQDMLCTDPISGAFEGSSPASANPGTLIPNGELSNATIEPGRVGASCRQGFLYINGDIPDMGAYVLPGNNYHVYDYALFWGAIRRDAARRLTSWRR